MTERVFWSKQVPAGICSRRVGSPTAGGRRLCQNDGREHRFRAPSQTPCGSELLEVLITQHRAANSISQRIFCLLFLNPFNRKMKPTTAPAIPADPTCEARPRGQTQEVTGIRRCRAGGWGGRRRLSPTLRQPRPPICPAGARSHEGPDTRRQHSMLTESEKLKSIFLSRKLQGGRLAFRQTMVTTMANRPKEVDGSVLKSVWTERGKRQNKPRFLVFARK